MVCLLLVNPISKTWSRRVTIQDASTLGVLQHKEMSSWWWQWSLCWFVFPHCLLPLFNKHSYILDWEWYFKLGKEWWKLLPWTFEQNIFQGITFYYMYKILWWPVWNQGMPLLLKISLKVWFEPVWTQFWISSVTIPHFILFLLFTYVRCLNAASLFTCSIHFCCLNVASFIFQNIPCIHISSYT